MCGEGWCWNGVGWAESGEKEVGDLEVRGGGVRARRAIGHGAGRGHTLGLQQGGGNFFFAAVI